ncbi:carboxypeptidase B-like [Nasonia vitripennis]|uniref:Peptidase M14 domain-containing protein n=1 Tax=Nasonia vitripennis TaxID=7425 RepID=A0A7M7G0U2_NASVI|nr:carboxypeptidase B-like [Nasonia vitripennis]
MRSATVVLCAAFALSALVGAEEYQASVYGMQGLKVSCDSEEKLNLVRSYENEPGFDFLRVARDNRVPVEVLVAPDQLQRFKRDLLANAIDFEVFVEDVSKVIDEELALQKRARMNRAGPRGSISLKAFPKYEEIVAYVDALAKSHSEIVEAFSIGKSFEGRDIVGVKISSGGAGSKPSLFIDAGIHAREWIAPSSAVYAIKQLVENATNHHIFDNIDIYVVPVLNPDGYSYTHKSTSTRMWRKTRSVHKSSSCIGVDANRNFEYEWMTVGASSSPCSDIYAGPKAFSEPETAALRDFILGLKSVKVYLTFHSYGQYLLHPWGFTTALPKNEPVLRCAAEKAEAELAKLRGTRYQIGSSTNVLYAAAGGSDDWVMGVAGAELAYTVELPGGIHGFAPPPKEIVPVGRETFEAIKVFASFVDNKVCQNVA